MTKKQQEAEILLGKLEPEIEKVLKYHKCTCSICMHELKMGLSKAMIKVIRPEAKKQK